VDSPFVMSGIVVHLRTRRRESRQGQPAPDRSLKALVFGGSVFHTDVCRLSMSQECYDVL
jgi:hypothetical protein